MKSIENSGSREQGGILLATVIIGGVLGVAVVAAVSLSGFHNETTVRSSIWNSTLALAEGGVEEALAQLNDSSGTWGANGWTLNGGQYSKRRTLGNDWYFVTVTTDPGGPVIVSTASMLLPAKSARVARAVRVKTERKPAGLRGMIAKGKVTVSGTVRTDSYDSSNPAYSTGGRYDPAKARDNGPIGSISTEPASVEVSGSARINGKVGTATAEGLKIGGSASAGSFAWNAAVANAGTVQPGWHTTDLTGSYTNVNFPTAAGTIRPGSGSLGGTNYTYVLDNSKYWLDSLTLNGKSAVLVTGNATLIINDTLEIGSTAGFQIMPGAKLTLYVRNAARIGGQGILNGTGNPASFTCYGGPENRLIKYSGSADLIGTMYAPSARLELTGNSAFYGASVSKEIVLGGGFSYHYDEALAVGAMRFGVTSWDEI